MKKLLLFLILICSPLHAEEGVEVIAGFDDKSDLPILNNELRKLDEQSQDIAERVTTIEGSPFTPSTSNALSGSVIQTVSLMIDTPVDITATTTVDDTPPLYSEGNAIGSVSITPTNASNSILIRATFWGTFSGGGTNLAYWINDATASDPAIAIRRHYEVGGGINLSIEALVSAGSTSARTYYLVANKVGDTFYVGRSSAGADLFGAAYFGSIVVQEIKA